MYRVRQSMTPCPAPKPASPDITYEIMETAAITTATTRTTATAMPRELFSEHSLQEKPSCAVYPSLQMLQSVQNRSGQQPGEHVHERGMSTLICGRMGQQPIDRGIRRTGRLLPLQPGAMNGIPCHLPSTGMMQISQSPQ